MFVYYMLLMIVCVPMIIVSVPDDVCGVEGYWVFIIRGLMLNYNRRAVFLISNLHSDFINLASTPETISCISSMILSADWPLVGTTTGHSLGRRLAVTL